MEVRCIDSERIADVVGLPADDPLRRHVDDCPRCRNILRSYQEFLRAEPVAGFPFDASRRKLDAMISSQVAGTASPRPVSQLSTLWHGLLRPAPFVAAAVAVMVVAVMLWQQSRGPEVSRLRDESTITVALPPADVRPDGSIHLSWPAVPDADAYQVRIYGPDLAEIYRHPVVAGTSAVIDRSALPADLPAQLDLMWRVYALQAGDTIEISEPGSIRIR